MPQLAVFRGWWRSLAAVAVALTLIVCGRIEAQAPMALSATQLPRPDPTFTGKVGETPQESARLHISRPQRVGDCP